MEIFIHGAIDKPDEFILGHIASGVEGIIDAGAFYVFLVKQVFTDKLIDECLVPKDLGRCPLNLDILGTQGILKVLVGHIELDGFALVIHIGHF